MTIHEIMEQAHRTAVEKGWWDRPRTFDGCLLLAHCELSEAVEAMREATDPDLSLTYIALEDTDVGAKPVGVASEIADVFIRLADACAHFGVPLAEAIALKMAYNAKRPYRHGGKAL